MRSKERDLIVPILRCLELSQKESGANKSPLRGWDCVRFAFCFFFRIGLSICLSALYLDADIRVESHSSVW